MPAFRNVNRLMCKCCERSHHRQITQQSSDFGASDAATPRLGFALDVPIVQFDGWLFSPLSQKKKTMKAAAFLGQTVKSLLLESRQRLRVVVVVSASTRHNGRAATSFATFFDVCRFVNGSQTRTDFLTQNELPHLGF